MIRLRLYDVFEGLNLSFIGPMYRRIGKSMAQAGLSIQGNLTSDDRLVPSLRCRQHNNTFPQLAQADFVAPNTVIVGNVNVGQETSIWYGATLRGESGKIQIGSNSIIFDLAQINARANKNVVIGDNVYVGSNAVLEGCTLENNSFVGMGATISEGAKVESYGIVAAGAVVPPGTVVKSNQIWAGNSAVYLRDVTAEEKQIIDEHHQESIYLARIHAEETEKNFREIIDDLDEKNNEKFEDSEALALKKMSELGFPMDFDDEDYLEQRVFLKKAQSPKESQFWKKQYDAYEQDLYHFPDSFKQYGENFEKYEEVKQYFEQNPNAEAKPAMNTGEFEYPTNMHDWTRKY